MSSCSNGPRQQVLRTAKLLLIFKGSQYDLLEDIVGCVHIARNCNCNASDPEAPPQKHLDDLVRLHGHERALKRNTNWRGQS
jgi:hypothetical protein